jgi:hypothetical protein
LRNRDKPRDDAISQRQPPQLGSKKNKNTKQPTGGSSYGSSRSLSPPIFVLCERCHWSATYFDKTKVPKDNNCPECISSNDNNDNDNTELTSFPILSNESFTFHYSDKTGVELEFKPRRKGS